MNYLIGLGSSLPQGDETIARSLIAMEQSGHITCVACSDFFDTPAAGGQTDFCFTNACAAITSNLSPDALWLKLQSVEHLLGRIRLFRNGPRTLDLDILWWSGPPFSSRHVQIPHSRFFTRLFALLPAKQAMQRAGWPVPHLLQSKCLAYSQMDQRISHRHLMCTDDDTQIGTENES